MNVVLDTSVVLRVVLRDAEPLGAWGEWDMAYASEMLRIEAFRKIFNLQAEGFYDQDLTARALLLLREILDNLTLVQLTGQVTARASGQFPTVLGTLDALHLATALALEELGVEELVFATHDQQQARAAAAVGLTVAGVG